MKIAGGASTVVVLQSGFVNGFSNIMVKSYQESIATAQLLKSPWGSVLLAAEGAGGCAPSCTKLIAISPRSEYFIH